MNKKKSFFNEECEICKEICNSIRFKRNFQNWTSGNYNIDKFIQNTQLSAHKYIHHKVIEWIPYDRFYDIKYIAVDKFDKVYKAKWIDGYIVAWDYKNYNRGRNSQDISVFLKISNNPTKIISEFTNETVPNKVYGITQNPETKDYIVVWNNEICGKCKYVCNAKHFQQNFKNWTSGNDNIDKFIQDTQLSKHSNWDVSKVLEWIPYDRFNDIEYIAKGGFGKVYRANWIDGPIKERNYENNNWKRNQDEIVALKSLNNSENVSLEFMNEIISHHTIQWNLYIIRLYGMTQDPETKNCMMVFKYASAGSLRNYLDENYNKLSWSDKLNCLCEIADGLNFIHDYKIIHRDLHVSNILHDYTNASITDMGLCKPADYNASEDTKNKIYGVLPYIAPEILRGQNYTKASDIYSFGIIMYEVISGLPPYHDVSHDKNLAIKICQGLRPRFNIKVPQLIVHLIKRCLDARSLNRPSSEELNEILYLWKSLGNRSELQEQIRKVNEVNENVSISNMPLISLGISYKTHSEAIYTSRLLDFNNLPEPKNSDDYYECYDNITSMEYSESQQIDVSQLKINEE